VTLQPPEDPYGHVLVSDAEREATVETLRVAHADGRLTFEELSDRSDLAYRARTAAELSLLTRDLPSVGGAPVRRPVREMFEAVRDRLTPGLPKPPPPPP
jgi:hypothetical protein